MIRKRYLKTVVIFLLVFQVIAFMTCKKPERVMVVSSGTESNVTFISADLSGVIDDLGEGATQHGHCYSKNPNPGIDGIRSLLGKPTSVGSFTTHLSNLDPGTKYYFRAYMSSAEATVYGVEKSFNTVSCVSPSSATNPATDVIATNAVLNGTVNANGISTTVSFEYGKSTSYGTTVNASQSPVSGSIATAVTAGVTGLEINTQYHYRVRSENCGGISYGTDQLFTSGCISPSASTGVGTDVGTTTATLNGTVNANGSSAIVTFEYGLTTSYGQTITASQSPVTGNSVTNASVAIGSLSPNTPYHFRIVATNCGGTTSGTDQTLTTICNNPTATTNAASNITTTSATLNGSVNANGSSTTVTFEYGTTTSYGQTISAIQSPVTGTGSTAVSAVITGLTSNTDYHYRIITVNCGGTIYGTDQPFSTPCNSPSAASGSVTGLSISGATLNGTVNANGSSTTVMFEYGLTASFGTTVTAAQSPVTGISTTAVSKSITGLTAGTTYYCRVAAISCGGTVYGNTLSFTTLQLPTATTNSASPVSSAIATLKGSVNANGSLTTVTFEYGLTTSYGLTATAAQSPLPGGSIISVSAIVSGLTEEATYHFRVKAQSAAGTVYGSDQSFKTTWSESFEGYASGTFPSTWTADGNADDDVPNNSVTSSIVYDGSKSLKLFGPIGGCWEGIAYHNLNASSTLEVEVAVRNGNETLSGCNPHRGVVGLRKGTSWSNPLRELVKFSGDGKIYGGGGTQLGTYTTNTWYLVKVRYEKLSSTEVILYYWINNVSSGNETLSTIADEDNLDHFELGALEGSVWFDKITITQY